eukprot:1965264-Alexandrium_andersonii.AAC.1
MGVLFLGFHGSPKRCQAESTGDPPERSQGAIRELWRVSGQLPESLWGDLESPRKLWGAPK